MGLTGAGDPGRRSVYRPGPSEATAGARPRLSTHDRRRTSRLSADPGGKRRCGRGESELPAIRARRFRRIPGRRADGPPENGPSGALSSKSNLLACRRNASRRVADSRAGRALRCHDRGSDESGLRRHRDRSRRPARRSFGTVRRDFSGPPKRISWALTWRVLGSSENDRLIARAVDDARSFSRERFAREALALLSARD